MTTTRDLTTWHLARLAACASPDRPDRYGWADPGPGTGADPSPGAVFLRNAADAYPEAAERIEAGEHPADVFHEIADWAVPVYTHVRWWVFTDLAAYQEEPTEFGPIEDMTDTAGACLYLIAERLLYALHTEGEADQ